MEIKLHVTASGPAASGKTKFIDALTKFIESYCVENNLNIDDIHSDDNIHRKYIRILTNEDEESLS